MIKMQSNMLLWTLLLGALSSCLVAQDEAGDDADTKARVVDKDCPWVKNGVIDDNPLSSDTPKDICSLVCGGEENWNGSWDVLEDTSVCNCKTMGGRCPSRRCTAHHQCEDGEKCHKNSRRCVPAAFLRYMNRY